MDTNQILLGIVLVGIIIIAGITLYNQFVPSQSITQIGESTTSINAEVAKLITSISTLTNMTSTMNVDITKFIKDSQDYYASNTNAINAINDLITSIQSSVFSKDDLMALLTLANDKLKKMKSGTFVGGSRGYFSVNDTAEQIANTVSSIQSNLASNTENYLLSSNLLSSYLRNEVERNEKIGLMNTNITNIQSNLNKTINNLDAFLQKIINAQVAIPTSIIQYCFRYADNPKRTLFYRPRDGSCDPKWGWGFFDPIVGSGGNLFGLNSAQPNTSKYCYKYSISPSTGLGTLFYKSQDGSCSTLGQKWNFNDPNVGLGGEVYLYPTKQPNTQKMCYRYSDGAFPQTLIYPATATGDCPSVPGFNYTFTDTNAALGSGGEFWVPTVQL